MVELLVENEILKNWGVNHERAGKPPPSISDMQGAFDFLGHIKLAQLNSTRAPTGDKWCMPPDPSYAQVRQNLTEYAILPNGSPFVKQQTPLVRSVLLCGPSGVGKTMLVESVARHLNAIVLDLSVDNTMGKFIGKPDTAKLLHLAFTVAKDPSMQPAVIYIDDVDMIFGGGKKKDKEGPSRFKADLSKYIGSLEREHSVVVIGCSKLESGERGTQLGGDDKDLNACFDRKLYIPAPNYATRTMMWTQFMREALGHEPPSSIDVSSLAQITEGYTAGGIKAAITSTITTRRMERIEKNPLTEAEFLRALSRQPRVYREKNKAFQDFMCDVDGPVFESDKIFMNKYLFGFKKTMGLSAAREKEKARIASAENGDDKKKKK